MPTISYGLRAMSAEHNPVKLTDWVMSLQDDAWVVSAYTTAQRGSALHVLKVRWQSLQEQRRTSQGGGLK